MSFFDDDDYAYYCDRRKEVAQSYKGKRIKRAGGGHVMGKEEAKLCRRLQAINNMTEEEVRSHKKFRKMLADVCNEPKYRLRETYAAPTDDKLVSSMAPEERFKMLVNGLVDTKTTKDLWKRYAGGLIDTRRPKNFHYMELPRVHTRADIYKCLAQTDGQFYYSYTNKEIGFMYEESMTMFALAWTRYAQ